MKILWHSVAPWAPTGYGQQTATFAPRIAALGHDLRISAYYGLQGSEMQWRGIKCLPSYSAVYGTDVLVPHAMDHFKEPGMTRVEEMTSNGLIITLCDVWVLDVPFLNDFNVAAWAPIDHETLPPLVRQWFVSTGAVPIAMSLHGHRLLSEADLNPLYVPHGIDTTVFSPGDMAEARDRAGLPQDAFIISIVAANMGKDASRKAFSEQIAAFKILREKHNDAILLLHTDVDSPVGVKIRDLIQDLPHGSVRYSDQYAYRKGMPASVVADIYRSSNLFTNTSWGEGFGIPIIEAQACGTPVVITDTTAMPELCGAGYKVPGEQFWHDSQKAWARRPYVGEIADSYLWAYDELRTADNPMCQEAWLFAQDYDAGLVMERYWIPALKKLENAVEGRKSSLFTVPDKSLLTERVVTSDGFHWIDRGSGTDDWVAYSSHEETLYPIMTKIMNEKDNGIFLDVGAHIGRWTLRMSRHASKVVAIEPNPEAVRQLRRHLVLNDVSNVDILEIAAWDEWTFLQLFDPNYRISGGSTRTVPAEDELANIHGCPLDDITELINGPNISLIKLDVEGADLYALRGMEGLLNKYQPTLLIECHDLYGYYTREELQNTLRSLNYSWGPVEYFNTAEYLVCVHD